MVKRSLAILLASLALGCDAPIVPKPQPVVPLSEARTAVAVALAMQTSGKSSDPVPEPKPSDDKCENCDGTGKVGDGRTVLTCAVCNGTGRKKKASDVQTEQEPTIDVAKMIDEIISAKLPASCPIPEPLDIDALAVKVRALLAADLQATIDDVIKKAVAEAMQARDAEIQAAEVKEPPKQVKPAGAVGPSPTAQQFTTTPDAAITLFVLEDSPEHLYAVKVLAPKLPTNWKLGFVYTNTAEAKYQMVVNRRVLLFKNKPTVEAMLVAIGG